MSEPKSGASPVSLVITAAVAGIGLVAARGGFEHFSTIDIAQALGGALAFGLVFFGGIHLLLKRWDRYRGR